MVAQLCRSTDSLISLLCPFLGGFSSIAPPCLKLLAFLLFTLEVFSFSSLWSSAFLLELVKICQIPLWH